MNVRVKQAWQGCFAFQIKNLGGWADPCLYPVIVPDIDKCVPIHGHSGCKGLVCVCCVDVAVEVHLLSKLGKNAVGHREDKKSQCENKRFHYVKIGCTWLQSPINLWTHRTEAEHPEPQFGTVVANHVLCEEPIAIPYSQT